MCTDGSSCDILLIIESYIRTRSVTFVRLEEPKHVHVYDICVTHRKRKKKDTRVCFTVNYPE